MLFPFALIFGCCVIGLKGAESETTERGDGRRPIWNMAHMVNEIYQIKEFLDLGANSIETDVTFDDDAMSEYTYHGIPCDCLRACTKWEHINDFLNALRRTTTPGDSMYRSQLLLVVFDLKTGSFDAHEAYKAGTLFAEKLATVYWNKGSNGGTADIVLSVPDIHHSAFLMGFRAQLKRTGFEHLLEKVGYDFSGNDDLDKTRNALHEGGVADRHHVWQSDGITNCIGRGLGRVRDAVRNRDSSYGFINKVYVWTIEKYVSVRDALDAGVDGIMTNEPDVIVNVLNEANYRNRFRLATREDNPWETFKQ